MVTMAKWGSVRVSQFMKNVKFMANEDKEVVRHCSKAVQILVPLRTFCCPAACVHN